MARRRPEIGRHPLAEYDWDDRTGVAVLVYADGSASKQTEPCRPAHRDWASKGRACVAWDPERSRSVLVRDEPAGLLSLIGERVEAQIVGLDPEPCWQYI
jgi:hypothetical protein